MLTLFKVFMSPTAGENVSQILNSGFITQGSKVEEFEKELQKKFNHPYILTLNSATSGLTLAYRLLNLQQNDEVLSTPLTCTATNWPILANNLSIKWIDIDKNTCNISLEDLENKISEKTKVISFVHWGGYPVNLEKVNEILDRTEKRFGNRPQIIEDCAHAFGATFNNKLLGTHGNIAVFSLQAIKHLTTGDGGLIFLPNKELYDRAKLLRWYGIDREYRSGKDFRLEHDVVEWGYKYHMNDIGATIGLSNLPFMENNLEKIRDNARYYRENLKDIKGVELLHEDKNCKSAYWIFTIKIVDKYNFLEFAKTKNIMSSQVHNRNDNHTCVKNFKSSLPNLDELEKEICCIPVGWWITEKDMEYIVKVIKDWCNEKFL